MEKIEQRVHIKARTKLGKIPIDIRQDLVKACGEQALSYSTVTRWVARFKAG